MEVLEFQRATSRNCLEQDLLRGNNLVESMGPGQGHFVDGTQGRSRGLRAGEGRCCPEQKRALTRRKVTQGVLALCVDKAGARGAGVCPVTQLCLTL